MARRDRSRSRTPLFRSPHTAAVGVQRAADRCGLANNRQGRNRSPAEAIADAFVRVRPEDFWRTSKQCWEACGTSSGQPSQLWAMDSVHFRCREVHTPNRPSKRKRCMAGQRGLAHAADAGGAKRSQETTVRKGGGSGSGHRGLCIRHLLVDRGLFDGRGWRAARTGTMSLFIGVREGGDYGRHDQPEPRAPAVGGGGSAADPHRDSRLLQIELARDGSRMGCVTCPLSACSIRDTYPSEVPLPRIGDDAN